MEISSSFRSVTLGVTDRLLYRSNLSRAFNYLAFPTMSYHPPSPFNWHLVEDLGVDLDTGLVKLTMRSSREGYSSKTELIKIVRFLRRVAPPELLEVLTDADMETLNNYWQSSTVLLQQTLNEDFEILRGEDIRDAYHEQNYTHYESHQLHSSCMRYGWAQQFLDIYVMNPEVVGLLVARDENEQIKARCLLWTDKNGNTLYDRAYASDVMIYAINAYCQEKGWLAPHEGADVMLKKAHFTYYPYMDNMMYLTLNETAEGGRLSYRSGSHTLGSTGGGPFHYYDASAHYCECCDTYFDEDDMTVTPWYSPICIDCFEDRFVTCEYSEASVDRDNTVEACFEVIQGSVGRSRPVWGMVDESLIGHDFEECEECNRYFHRDLLHDVGGDFTVVLCCGDCVEDNYSICDECGEYEAIEFMTDGMCPPCADRAEQEEANEAPVAAIAAD